MDIWSCMLAEEWRNIIAVQDIVNIHGNIKPYLVWFFTNYILNFSSKSFYSWLKLRKNTTKFQIYLIRYLYFLVVMTVHHRLAAVSKKFSFIFFIRKGFRYLKEEWSRNGYINFLFLSSATTRKLSSKLLHEIQKQIILIL